MPLKKADFWRGLHLHTMKLDIKRLTCRSEKERMRGRPSSMIILDDLNEEVATGLTNITGTYTERIGVPTPTTKKGRK